MKMMRNCFYAAGLLTVLIYIPVLPANAQEENSRSDSLRKDALKIFIDCRRCDMNYIRDEIPYVNYVRDVKEAQVYVLETVQPTGSGGNEYTYTYVGQKNFRGMNDTLRYSSRPDDPRDLVREGRTNMLKMGLMRYVARTPIHREVQIRYTGEKGGGDVSDRWNYWVFELETRPSLEGEETLKEFNLRNSVNASKITPDWKLEFDFDQSLRTTKYDYEDTTYRRERSTARLDNLIVKSLSDHWSAGVEFSYVRSTYSNLQLNTNFYPSVEYDIYPYSEATHRQLRILYGIGHSYYNYIDTTIFDKIYESLFSHKLEIAYQVQEKWGSINLSLGASNFLHDFSKNRLTLEGSVRIRILKGLSFSVYGDVARIRDQISLVKEDLEEADILLRLQELATAYNYDVGIGITYTFGSIYNNIVNPRFGNGNYWDH